jgi:cell division protein FtsQ
LKNATVVRLPALNEQGALAQLADLQTSMALLDRPVAWIDLRLPGRLVIHPYPPVTGHT